MTESQAASPGMISASTAVRPEVTATARKAGTARRLANGAAMETCWKLIAEIGIVNATEAIVMERTSRAMRPGEEPSNDGRWPKRRSSQLLRTGVTRMRPRTAAKLSG